MPGNPKAIVRDAERRLPVWLLVNMPPGGVGAVFTRIEEWLDEHCGVGWSITPAGTRGLLNDPLAVYVNSLPIRASSRRRPTRFLRAAAERTGEAGTFLGPFLTLVTALTASLSMFAAGVIE
jgi:hypothetical protein